MSEELKPCPFCGGRAKLWYDDTAGYMGCKSDSYVYCGCCQATGSYKKSDEEAIAAWNERKPLDHSKIVVDD